MPPPQASADQSKIQPSTQGTAKARIRNQMSMVANALRMISPGVRRTSTWSPCAESSQADAVRPGSPLLTWRPWARVMR